MKINWERLKVEFSDHRYYTERKIKQFICGILGHHWFKGLQNVDICIYCEKIKGK